MSWYCGSMPCTLRRRGVVAALHLHAAALQLRADHRHHPRLAPRSRARRRAVRQMRRPARSPPACMLVRPPQTMPMFLPELAQHVLVAAPEALAGRRQDDDRDHAPQDAEHRQEAAQLVGAQVLERPDEGFAHGVTRLSDGELQSRLARQDDLVALLQAARGPAIFVPLPTPTLTGDLAAAGLRAGVERPRRTRCAARRR